jgi:hypothetical protein
MAGGRRGGPRRRKVSAREERRRLGYRLLQRRVPKSAIARQLDVSYLTVLNWAKRREAEPNFDKSIGSLSENRPFVV